MNAYVLSIIACFGALLALPLIGARKSLRRHWLSGAVDRDGVRVIEIVIQGGFHPATIRVRQGERVRLLIRRAEDDPCTARIYFTHPFVDRALPAFATTALTFVADTSGRHLFTCEEGRHCGHIVVEPTGS